MIRGSADKSLARPGRKQATAIKLGIYWTYFPRSSIHFLASCSNFCKPLKKKKFRRLSVRPGLRGRNELRVGRKMVTFQLFLQSRDQVLVRRGQIQRIGWVIKTLEARVGQFLLGCKRPVNRGILVQEQDPLGELTAGFFLQNVLRLHQQRQVILRIDSLEDNQRGGCRLDPKKSRRELSQGIFALGIFWGGMSRYAATPLIVALSPGHSDITRFRAWSPVVIENHLDRAEKNFKSFSDDWHRWRLWSPFRHFGTHLRRATACANLHEWWTQPAHVRCPVAQLLI